jgi:Flp pilus assembly protein TadD
MGWALLGLSEFERKEFDDSLAAIEKAQSLGIDDVEVERVSIYHLGLLLVRDGQFERATDVLLETFGGGVVSEQVKFALGLAMLRVALLPEQIDPSHEALVLAAGEVVSAGADTLKKFPPFLQVYPDVPYSQYAYGRALANAGRDNGAIVAMRAETKLSPDSALPWIEISRLELKRGQFTAARFAGEKAVALDAASKAAHEVLSASLHALGEKQSAAKQQSLAEQSPAVRQIPERRILDRYAGKPAAIAAAVNPQEDGELWEQATREFSTGNYSAAAVHLREWLPRNPGDGTGWAMLGLAEFALKDFDNALIHLNRGEQIGVRGNAESVQSAKYSLGILLVHTGEFERATEVLVSAWKAGPLDDKVEYALGLALLRKAEFPDQGKAAESSLISAAGGIAILLQQSKYDVAFGQLKPLIQQYPSTPFLHYSYGTALLALSEFDEAAAQMQAEAIISPSSALPYIRLASIALREHNPAEAILRAKHAVEFAANSAEAHYLLGRASLESGDNATALRELEIASRLSPGSPEVHFNLAKAYTQAKMPEKAEQERARFSELNEIAEKQRSQQGTQIYTGPHDPRQVTTNSPAN